MRISDWSSDVCSSDLHVGAAGGVVGEGLRELLGHVESPLGEDLRDSGVDVVARRRARGADADAARAVVVEKDAGRYRAAGVVGADDEDLRMVGHGASTGAGPAGRPDAVGASRPLASGATSPRPPRAGRGPRGVAGQSGGGWEG